MNALSMFTVNNVDVVPFIPTASLLRLYNERLTTARTFVTEVLPVTHCASLSQLIFLAWRRLQRMIKLSKNFVDI
jgi:hypothetical protein